MHLSGSTPALGTESGSNPPTRRREYKILPEFTQHKVVRLFIEGVKPSLINIKSLTCSG
jgi:hypothetical protein